MLQGTDTGLCIPDLGESGFAPANLPLKPRDRFRACLCLDSWRYFYRDGKEGGRKEERGGGREEGERGEREDEREVEDGRRKFIEERGSRGRE